MKNKLTLEDIAVDHSYFCSMQNAFNSQIGLTFENWESFFKEWGEYDLDLALLFRWDIKERSDEVDQLKFGKFYMELFLLKQKRGVFVPIYIRSVVEENVDEITTYLNTRYIHIHQLWQPISK